jgi:hypothetical protein
VAAVLGASIVAIGQPHAAVPDVAKQAARPALFVAPTGSDARSCRTPRAACATFQRAYRLARPGQIVEVAGGDYPEQAVTVVPGRKGPNVVFQPAAGERVTLGGLRLGIPGELGQGPSHLTFRRMRMAVKGSAPGARNEEGISIGAGSKHIRLERMDAGSLHTWFADHVTVVGGDFGPCHAVAGPPNVCGNSMIDVSSNVTIDGALFHDYRFDPTCFTPAAGSGCHYECMYVNGGANITIRNSKFRDCAIYDIFATISGPDAGRLGHRNLLIENNWFDTPWTEDTSGGARARASAVSLAWCQNSPQGYRGVVVRFNSFQRNTGVELDRNPACRFEDVSIVGNLLSYPGNCDSRITYAYNVWTTAIRSGRCSPTDRIAGNALPYANPQSGRGFDFRLVKGRRTVADDLVPAAVPGGCPRADIDRKRRSGRRCDAGSDER